MAISAGVLTATFIQIVPFLVTLVQERQKKKDMTVAEMKEMIGKMQHDKVMNGIDFTQLKIDELAELIVNNFDELSKKLDCINNMIGASMGQNPTLVKTLQPVAIKETLSKQALDIINGLYGNESTTMLLMRSLNNPDQLILQNPQGRIPITDKRFLVNDFEELENLDFIMRRPSQQYIEFIYAPTRAGQAFYDSIQDSLS